uniref:Uncharacterized protein n=1 Tax=Anguilla anguilla TaxID=7936 RepID=A0A0E9VVJ2_ANGAN
MQKIFSTAIHEIWCWGWEGNSSQNGLRIDNTNTLWIRTRFRFS